MCESSVDSVLVIRLEHSKPRCTLDTSMRSSRRLLCGSTARLDDFAAVALDRISPEEYRLVTKVPSAVGSILFRWTGVVQRHQGVHSIQVGREAHLISAVEATARAEGMPLSTLRAHLNTTAPQHPWLYLHHSFKPTVHLEQRWAGEAVTMAARVLRPLNEGDGVSFDYTLHEWQMSHPFQCEQTGRWVSGFSGLSEEEMDTSLPRAAEHIKLMHAQWLFGQHSRC